MKKSLSTLAAMLLVAGAAPALAADTDTTGSYAGIFPCADCPGIEYRLDLFDDGVFYQSLRYQEREGRFDSVGRWQYGPDNERIELNDADSAPPTRFSLEDGSLTMLDMEGKRIESNLNYTLYRSDLLSRIEPRVTIKGLFTYFADTATLQDCFTGRLMPVAMEREYIKLERAWLNSNASLENPLPVSVKGRIVERVNMEGPKRPTVIVETFEGSGEALRCSPPAPDFYGTEWRLTALDGVDITRNAGLQFSAGNPPNVTGSTGCNRVFGSFQHEGDAVSFGMLATTKMACVNAAEQENTFLRVLSETTHHRIQGRELQLLDATSAVRARFEASR